MAQDILQEVRDATVGGQFYGMWTPRANTVQYNYMHNAFCFFTVECPKGHTYYVGDVSIFYLIVVQMSIHVCIFLIVWKTSSRLDM